MFDHRLSSTLSLHVSPSAPDSPHDHHAEAQLIFAAHIVVEKALTVAVEVLHLRVPTKRHRKDMTEQRRLNRRPREVEFDTAMALGFATGVSRQLQAAIVAGPQRQFNVTAVAFDVRILVRFEIDARSGAGFDEAGCVSFRR